VPEPSDEPWIQRLSKYRLEPDALSAESLRVPSGDLVALSSGNSFHPPRLLRPGNIGVLKDWIGVPDRVFDGVEGKSTPRVAPSAALARLRDRPDLAQIIDLAPGHRDARDLDRQLTEQSSSLSALTQVFLYGDARPLEDWRGVLDAWTRRRRVPVWIYRTLTVERGGVLEVGDGFNVLVVRRLVLREGGTIRVRGRLKMDLERLQRTA